jgi:hypothetical protein
MVSMAKSRQGRPEGRLAGHGPAEIRSDDQGHDDVQGRGLGEGAPSGDADVGDPHQEQQDGPRAELRRAGRAVVGADQGAEYFHGGGNAGDGCRVALAHRPSATYR